MFNKATISENLFSVLGNKFSNYSSFSGTALSRAIDLYLSGNYEGSIRELRRAISLDPYSENSIKAYEFMAQAFLKLQKKEDAEKTYREAIKLFPQNDNLYLKLGYLYFHEGRYKEAEDAFLKAVRLNPSEDNLYALGQAYLSLNKFKEAKEIFQRILKREPKNYGTLYALGQIYVREENYGEAIKIFKEVISIKSDFAYAYFDLGALYADMNEFSLAEEQIRILEGINKDLAEDLKAYILKVKKPGFIFVDTSRAFNIKRGPGTPLSSLDPALSVPGASKRFMIEFYFDKPMDRRSVEKITNWSITRSSGINQGGLYNWGLPVPQTEISINPLPDLVIYNSQRNSATVIFTLKQNSTGDGTIDPSHIIFRFYGKDIYGNYMDPSKDEYGGLSLIV
ncbi:MAG: tetratricopeptide repeat protein [Thermodesulfovibrionales bacterium]|nr:tetratricopeptide repeat protein [Thermodesulfovibrionales bacterium]